MARKDFFNMAAETWDKRSQTQELLEFVENLILELPLKPGQKVLDVGTGTGILIPFLVKAVGPKGHVIGVDYAEKMVELCREKSSSFPNVSIFVQQVEKLQFDSASFDMAVCFGLFPHLEDREEALYQLNRVLRKNGRLVIAHALGSVEIRNHHRNSEPAVSQDTLPSRSEMKKLLKQAGFGKIKIHDQPGRYVCLSIKL